MIAIITALVASLVVAVTTRAGPVATERLGPPRFPAAGSPAAR